MELLMTPEQLSIRNNLSNNIMILKKIIFLSLASMTIGNAMAQDYYSATQREHWMHMAKMNTPILKEREIIPENGVKLVKDQQAFQGWKVTSLGKIDSLYIKSFKKQSGVIVDLGDHYTGHFTFSLSELNSVSDSPIRLKFTFAEVPAELATPFDPYKGSISRAWLQDETVTIEQLPATVTIPRRLSCRYIKIEILGDSPYADFRISRMKFIATTSVTSTPTELAETTDPIIKQIDKVGQNTLKECMQTVYEDGPKRDHRLWIGDLYLQMLANNCTFKEDNLSKRCLYLMAGLAASDGILYTNAFESPQPHAQTGVPILLYEYPLIYNAALKCYYDATGDKETCEDLWPVAMRQISKVKDMLDKNDMFSMEKAKQNHLWLLIDWKDDLDRQTSEQGLYIYTLRKTYELGMALGKKNEVSFIPTLINKMTKGARSMYDSKLGVFVSGESKQVSYASQAWMILAKVVNKKEAQSVIHSLRNMKDVVKPGSPYLYHYYIQALIDCGLNKEAKQELTNFWGGMVKKGADTFWEVYDPNNDFISPYGFAPVNSYCHAWSCTPVYFIRKYPEIFQK